MDKNKLYIFCTAVIICLLISSSECYSQKDSTKSVRFRKEISLSAGMGLSYGTSPSFTSYLREVLPLSKDSVKSFKVGIEFFGGLEYQLSKKFSLRLEYSYFIRSISYTYSYYTFDYFINIHQPYLVANYLLKYKNFEFKLGAGAGYHFANLENKLSQSNTVVYNSHGIGYKGEVVFSANLSRKFHSYISGFVYGSTLSSLKDSQGNLLKSPQSNSEVNLGGVGAGVRLGFSIILN
jgi:hypothetical protein